MIWNVSSLCKGRKRNLLLSAKIDDEATLGSKYNKHVKELLSFGKAPTPSLLFERPPSLFEDLVEELSIERAERAKAEKSHFILKKDIEDLGSRLEEAGANTAT